MQVSSHNRLLIAWLLLGGLAAAVCSLIWPAAHVGNELLPVGNDSFYHARRILDAAHDPSLFYEFDLKIHAPEGSLLTWPWGYDYSMAWLARIGVALGIAADPMAILIWIPVASVFVSIGLMLLLTTRLSLSPWFSVLAGLCVALSPLTQYLHGVGFIDHHFAEYIFVLATVTAGLWWFSNFESARSATVLGIVLGIAPAIHNGLFVLQIPVLVTLLIIWLQGGQPPPRSTAAFCAALLLATLAVLIPSLPFRERMFEYYLLSWFHLYVASGTAFCSGFFARYAKSSKTMAGLGAAGAVLLVPLVYQIGLAGSFLTGDLTRLDAIAEMQSIRQLIPLYGALDISSRYSLFIWLVPATYAYCLFKAWRKRQSRELFFWICAIFGLSLLIMQFRLHYFGSFALYVPVLMAVKDIIGRWPAQRTRIMLATTLVVLLMYAPTLRYQLLGPMMHANDVYFLNLRPVLSALSRACKKDPGIVLADNDVGHYVRYYTDCPVIANNFLLTEQHGRKIREMERLFGVPATELPVAAPFVRYVLVRPAFIGSSDKGTTYVSYSTGSSDLIGDLLMKPSATPPVPAPKAYELLHEARLRDGDKEIPYARLYRVRPELDGSAKSVE